MPARALNYLSPGTLEGLGELNRLHGPVRGVFVLGRRLAISYRQPDLREDMNRSELRLAGFAMRLLENEGREQAFLDFMDTRLGEAALLESEPDESGTEEGESEEPVTESTAEPSLGDDSDGRPKHSPSDDTVIEVSSTEGEPGYQERRDDESHAPTETMDEDEDEEANDADWEEEEEEEEEEPTTPTEDFGDRDDEGPGGEEAEASRVTAPAGED